MTSTFAGTTVFNRWSVIAAALIAGTVTTLPSYALPFIVGSLAEEFALTGRQAGWVGTAVMAGFGAGTLFTMYWQTRWKWRRTCFFHSLIAVGFYSLMRLADSIEVALLFQFAGAAGLGGMYALVLTIFSRHKDPDRMIGIFMFVQIVFTSGYILSLSPLISRFGSFGIFGSLAAITLLIIPSLFWLPKGDFTDTGAHNSVARPQFRFGFPLALALISLLCFGLNTAGVASYLERMGNHAGLSLGQISSYIAIANLVSILGPALAIWWGDRFNRLLPLFLAVFCNFVGMVLLWNGGDSWLYPIGASLFFISWMLGLPYLYATIAALDESRTIMPIAAVVLIVGSSLAPVFAGIFVTENTFNGVNIYGIVWILACYAFVIPVLLRKDSLQDKVQSAHPE
jgi:MFS family permease